MPPKQTLKPRRLRPAPSPFATANQHATLPRRRSRVPIRTARQSYLAFFLALLLFTFRTLRFHFTTISVRHEAFIDDRDTLPPSMASLLHLHGDNIPLSIHFFTAPKPFIGNDRLHQLRAIESWLALSPRPKVTLLGDGLGYDEVATMYKLQRLTHVDATFLGVPLFNAMLAATNTSQATVSVLLNADIILYDDFPYALRKIRRDFPPGWLAVAARWDVHSLPTNLLPLGPARRPSENIRHAIVRYARTEGVLHTYGGIDLWAWDAASGPLIEQQVPPFVYGRGKYDNWLTHEVITANKRAVVDVSEACTLVHVKHDHHLVPSAGTAVGREGFQTTASGVGSAPGYKQEFWSTDPRGKFELYVNSYLAAAHGSYTNQMGTILHAPLKLTSCYEHDGFCIFQRVRPHSCRCEHSPYVAEAQNDPYIVGDSRVIFCGLLSSNVGSDKVDRRDRWVISGRLDDGLADEANVTSSVTFGLPLIQEHLFKVISSRTNSNRVVLVVADFSERRLVMESVCSMRANGMFRWLMIAALDDDLYRYCVTRGLPVYLSEFDESEFKDHVNFRELARFQLTFEALRKGKEVLSIEPGVVFSSTPWQYFKEVIEGDANVATLPRPDTTLGIAQEKSYIPSAFVYARPGAQTLELLRKVMMGLQQHLAKSGLLLRNFGCGENDQGRLKVSRCQLGKQAVVHLLDRQLFRALEAEECAACPDPLLYYSASFGLNSAWREVVESLRRKGLSRIQQGEDFCARHT